MGLSESVAVFVDWRAKKSFLFARLLHQRHGKGHAKAIFTIMYIHHMVNTFSAEPALRNFQSSGTLGRIATPEDIALAARFPASDGARWITGQVIVAAGGKRM